MKKLSVIVPIYNGERYLNECLDSLIIDTNEVEYILINDGSTDCSKEICSKFASKNVIIINNENNGVSFTRNLGIKMASGKYLMFVDCDDILTNNWYNIVQEYLDCDYDIVYFNKTLENNASKNELYNMICAFNSNNYLSAPFSKIYKRKMIIDYKISFCEKLVNGEDMIFNIECMNKCNSYFIDNRGIYLYRVFEGSSTKQFNRKIFESDFLFQSIIKSVLPDNLSKKDDILLFCVQNACFTFINRLSYLKSFSEVKRYLKVFNEEPYVKLMTQNIIVKNKKIKFVLSLLKNKKFYICFILLKIKRLGHKGKKSYLVNI